MSATKTDQMLLPRAGGTVLDAVGNTPILNIDGVWAKLEFLNPSGSIKARLARWVVEEAEATGRIAPGDTIVEASSGNTGNALAMVAAVKGYRMIVVMPHGLSDERQRISRAFGAEVELVGDFHVSAAIERAAELGQLPGYFYPAQFSSESNVTENCNWLGSELRDQLAPIGTIGSVVAGIGTGGSLIGTVRALRNTNPGLVAIGVEPEESRTIGCAKIARHVIEGIADGLVPDIVLRHRSEIDEIHAVSGDDALAAMRQLAARHGLLVGPSSGANYVVARQLIERGATGEVVTFFCDEGEKYLSSLWR